MEYTFLYSLVANLFINGWYSNALGNINNLVQYYYKYKIQTYKRLYTYKIYIQLYIILELENMAIQRNIDNIRGDNYNSDIFNIKI